MTVGGREVAFVELGDHEAPAVVLIHGFASSSAMWDDLAPLLSPWMRVLVPDLLGRGDPRSAADAVRGLFEGLGVERPAIVGHAEGGSVAQLLALDGRAAALVLMDAIPLGPEEEARLGGLEIPALVLWGEDDEVVDVSVAERLGDVMQRASVAVLPGCGHFVLAEAPATVAPLVFQWLRSQYLKIEHRHEAAGPVVVELGRRPAGGT